MESSGISSLSNPMLRYKLDLGEPGIPAPSPASHSVVRVVGHELGNIHRFKAEAARDGGIVVYHGIKLNLTQKGPFLAAIGGLSEARIVYPEGYPKFPGDGKEGAEEDSAVSGELESLDKALDSAAQLTNDILPAMAAQSDIASLQLEKALLQRELREAEAENGLETDRQGEPSHDEREDVQEDSDEPQISAQTSASEGIRKYQIQQEIQKLNREIAQLTLEPRQSQEEEPGEPPRKGFFPEHPTESMLLDVMV
jgi:hypothetical protein